jgi:hypothetical protein
LSFSSSLFHRLLHFFSILFPHNIFLLISYCLPPSSFPFISSSFLYASYYYFRHLVFTLSSLPWPNLTAVCSPIWKAFLLILAAHVVCASRSPQETRPLRYPQAYTAASLLLLIAQTLEIVFSRGGWHFVEGFFLIFSFFFLFFLQSMIIFFDYIKYSLSISSKDRLCGLVVRVLDYRCRGPGFDSRALQEKSSGSGTGSTQPREYNWGATW